MCVLLQLESQWTSQHKPGVYICSRTYHICFHCNAGFCRELHTSAQYKNYIRALTIISVTSHVDPSLYACFICGLLPLAYASLPRSLWNMRRRLPCRLICNGSDLRYFPVGDIAQQPSQKEYCIAIGKVFYFFFFFLWGGGVISFKKYIFLLVVSLLMFLFGGG